MVEDLLSFQSASSPTGPPAVPPDPSVCSRCSQPLVEESANGMCDVCSKAVETSKPEGTPLSPNFGDETRTNVDRGPETLTKPPTEPITSASNARTKLRPAPPGYDLFRYLGGGGMGDVYLALEHATDRVVAMKFLRAAASPTAIERFLNEVRALARIDHPNIVRLFEVELDRPDPHFTMEFASGGTLSDHIKVDGVLPVREAVEMVSKIARAMHAAHEVDVIHRDLKPSNIVLTADGVPKVSDFGLAKRLDFDGDLTRTSQAVGTPAFMPPEQISREFGDKFDRQSDVYGLGATLFTMLIGRPPFDDPAQDVLLRKVRHDLPPRLRPLRPEVPLELEAIVFKCLEKKPANRYPTAAALADALDRFLTDGTVRDEPKQTPLRRLKQWVGRNRISLSLAAAVAIALGATFAFGMWYSPPPPNPPDPAEVYLKELQAGRAVKLVDEKGPPKWHRMAAGKGAVSQTEDADEAAAFLANEMAALELLPDPGLDRYVLKANIRFLNRTLAQAIIGRAGFYVGGANPANDEGWTVSTCFTLNYREFVPEKDLKTRLADADFSPAMIAEFPGKPFHGHIFKMPPSVRFPGVHQARDFRWWPVRIEVTPQGVRAFWGNRQINNNDPFTTLTPEAINAKNEELRKTVQQTRNVKYDPPPWAPRQSIGLWAYEASVAFRNVIVEPLP